MQVPIWLHHGKGGADGKGRGWILCWASGTPEKCVVHTAVRKGPGKDVGNQVWCRGGGREDTLEGRVEVGDRERWNRTNGDGESINMQEQVWLWADQRPGRGKTRELQRIRQVPAEMRDQHDFIQEQLEKVAGKKRGSSEREWRAATGVVSDKIGAETMKAADLAMDKKIRPATREEEAAEAGGGKVPPAVKEWRKAAGSREVHEKAVWIHSHDEDWMWRIIGSGAETGGVCECAVEGGRCGGGMWEEADADA